MRQPPSVIRCALVALALSSTVVVPAVAATAAGAAPPVPLAPDARAAPPRSARELPRAYMVQLDAPPAAVAATTARRRGASTAQSAQQARRQRTGNAAAQRRTVRAAWDRGLVDRELYRVTTAYNGVAVMAAPGDVPRLRELPGVRSVVPLPRHERGNATSVPSVGAPAAWQAPGGGFAGHGVRVGVIDSGIDYVHRAFGGSGSASDLAAARSAASNPLAPSTFDPSFTVRSESDAQLFPSDRVAGGFDFAGDAYDADRVATSLPRPDRNPMDCPYELGGGHGTHVAATAGGTGVAADGGVAPWQTAWPPAQTPIVGTGVAPASELYALRVFGCDGSTNLVPLAIDWALDPDRDGSTADRLDVLNLSLGSPFGNQEDPSAVAVQNAVAAGVAVVTSAGNSGDQTYQAGSPGVASRAVTVANMVSGSALAGTVAASSSRGPAGGGSLKPDLAAPGTAISSARAGAGTGAVTFSGTSMAAPHVAGAMAIMRQRRPTWTVEELKAALLNTASPDLHASAGGTGPRHLPSRVGTGTLDVAAAVETEAVAFAADADGAVGVSFGPLRIPVGAPFAAEREIELANRGATAVTYGLSFDDRNPLPGVSWQVLGDADGASITVPANDRRTIRLRLRVDDPSQLRNRRDPILAAVQATYPRRWLAEATGLVRLTAPGRPTLSVAAHASVRPASATSAVAPSVGVAAETGSGTIALTGSGFASGATVDDFQARRTVLEHHATSPRRAVPPDQPPLAHADLRHVGVAGDADGVVTFGLAFWDRLPAPAGFTDVEISIDRDGDGSVEHVVYPTRLDGTDVFATCVWRIASNEPGDCFHAPSTAISPTGAAGPEGGTFDSELLTLAVPREAIGLDAPGVELDYTVRTWGPVSNDVVDAVGPLHWAPDAPGVRFATDALTADVPGSVPLAYDADAADESGTLGALILHHLGAAEQTAETVGITVDPPVVDPPVVDPPVVDPPVVDPPVVTPPVADPPVATPPVAGPPVLIPPPFVPPPVVPLPPPAPAVAPETRAPAKRCRVPRVTGRSLRVARKRLRRANCRTGKVTRPKARKVRGKRVKQRPLVVHRQSIKPGRTRKAGTKVALRMRERSRR